VPAETSPAIKTQDVLQSAICNPFRGKALQFAGLRPHLKLPRRPTRKNLKKIRFVKKLDFIEHLQGIRGGGEQVAEHPWNAVCYWTDLQL